MMRKKKHSTIPEIEIVQEQRKFNFKSSISRSSSTMNQPNGSSQNWIQIEAHTWEIRNKFKL